MQRRAIRKERGQPSPREVSLKGRRHADRAVRAPIPIFVAIVGGSGSGKSWLAKRLQTRLGTMATRITLDDFYKDRSHLPPQRRAKVNFDHPAAINWKA